MTNTQRFKQIKESAARLSCRALWVDPSGRPWGIRIFSIADQEIIISALYSHALNSQNDARTAILAQMCLCSPVEPSGMVIKMRRALGLFDYSSGVMLKLVKSHRAALRDAICEANFECDFAKFIDRLIENKDDDKRKPSRTPHGAKWGDIAGGMFVNHGVLPAEFLTMTTPQLNAISGILQKNKRRNDSEERMERLLNHVGKRR